MNFVRSEEGMRHENNRMPSLAKMKRLYMCGNLQPFLHTINVVRAALHGLAQKEMPVRDPLVECHRNVRRTRRMIARRTFSSMQ